MTNFKITGKNFNLTEGIKDAVAEKVDRIKKFTGEDASIDVVLSVKNGRGKSKCAEVTVKIRKNVIRAEAFEEDMYKAITETFATVTERVKKIKDKQKKRAGSDSIRLPEVEETTDMQVGSFVIEREKIIAAESMTREEACEEMDLTDHDFYVFRDKDKDEELSIVYRRKTSGYGIITLE